MASVVYVPTDAGAAVANAVRHASLVRYAVECCDHADAAVSVEARAEWLEEARAARAAAVALEGAVA